MNQFVQEGIRYIPSIHNLLQTEQVKKMQEKKKVPLKLITEVLQGATEKVRVKILDGDLKVNSKQEAMEMVLKEAEENFEPADFQRQIVVNATGTVLHTNLGRARLSSRAAKHAYEVATSYSNLEYDLETGKRGSRNSLVEELIKKATGAEAAIAVNNNAAAVFFVLSAFAKQKEVLVSRGELVEIGGSFRISSIMEESGAYLTEVGTTNKTRTSDYLTRVSEHTAMVMKVHTSNFAIIGFTESVSAGDLKQELTQQGKSEVIVYDDLGSGSLFPYTEKGIGEEPVIKTALQSGTDLVSFSGDKLLGGPQAGIIAGKKPLIDRLKKHQLARVLRLDKMTLAALESTLYDYLYLDNPEKELPALRDITASPASVHETALQRVKFLSLATVEANVEKAVSKVGGGTMPLVEIPTTVLNVKKKGWSGTKLEKYLRELPVPVIGRIYKENFYLDMRTVDESDWNHVAAGLKSLDKST